MKQIANLEKKTTAVTTKYKTDFKNDLIPFISNTKFLDDYVENYAEEFERYEITQQPLPISPS